MVNESNREIEEKISEKFIRFGNELGFSEFVTTQDKTSTKLYAIGSYALQLEIDWREYEVFMYVVKLIDGQIPDDKVIYRYPNGQWCRKYLEEIYQFKRIFNKNKRYLSQHLYESFDFLIGIIRNNPEVLHDYMHSND